MKVSATVLGAVAIAAVVGGCATSVTAPAGKAAATRTGPVARSDIASTPERGAIGFDKSIGRFRAGLRYDCNQSSTFTEVVNMEDRGAPTAAKVRIGTRWIVTVVYRHDWRSRTRFEVSHQNGGYCVSRILPTPRPRIGPSSYAPYSGTATTGPPK